MATGKRKKRSGIAWRPLLRSAALGVGVLFLAVLILTAFVYLGWLPESAIPVANTVIKILTALAAGIFIGVGRDRAPWFFGGIAGNIALLIAVAGMALYLGSFELSWNLLTDFLMVFAVGSAAAAVFLRRKKE